MQSVSEAPVVLRDGVIVPMHVIRLAWSLEDRGLELVEDDGELVVTPGSRLTAEDAAAIRASRDHLLRLARYIKVIV